MWRRRRCFHDIQGTGMMPIISATRAKTEGEEVPPSYSGYCYDAYYPSYHSKGRGEGGVTIIFKVWVCCLPSQLPERRCRGRGCHHHIQGMVMMPTIPVPRKEVEREGVPPSYSRYGYDAYHPSYQSGGGGGGGATIIFKVRV
jgi:hypothetical protein